MSLYARILAAVLRRFIAEKAAEPELDGEQAVMDVVQKNAAVVQEVQRPTLGEMNRLARDPRKNLAP